MSDMVEMLRRMPAFRRFSSEELAALDSALMLDELEDGHRLTVQGKRSSHLHILLSGQVKVTRLGPISQRVRRINTLGRGDLCGLQSLVDGLREETTCTARGPVMVASLTRQVCTLLMSQSAGIAFHFQLMVGNQLAGDLAERKRAIRAQLQQQ